MAIEHLVCFRFREDISEARRSEYVAALNALKSLNKDIPGLLRIDAGANFCDRSQGCQVGLVVTLESKADLEAYQVHPSHVAVAKGLRADCDFILALDFERP